MFNKYGVWGRFVIAVVSTMFFLAGCANQNHRALPLQTSGQYYNFIQPSFHDYVVQTELWLSQHRGYITQDKTKELNMNMPFQLSPSQPTQKAVLLAHGLGDSPYTFVDVARDLVEQGFHVQVLLLPGHGSKPEDLMLPTYQDWQYLVDHYAGLLKEQYNEVWLGGFSTGANLVTTHAIEQGGIDGLLLFSPGFQSKAGHLEKLTPILASVIDWGWRTAETNIAKYSSSPLNSAVAYSQSAAHIRSLMQQSTVDIPTLMVASEADSIVDPEAMKMLFVERFTHPDSQLIWYGETPQQESRVVAQSMDIASLRISSASHMSVMFKANNPYYGMDGEKRICENSLDSDDTARCEEGEPVWFAAWGHEEQGKLFARLTWNPHYNDMLRQIVKLTQN